MNFSCSILKHFGVPVRHNTLPAADDDCEYDEHAFRVAPIEHRGISFYVKDEYKTLFASEFKRLFGSDYVLFTREEALEKELFGPGEPNAHLTGIGDYIAAAVGEKTLYPSKTLCRRTFKSQHAGMTEAEMKIPLIVWKS